MDLLNWWRPNIQNRYSYIVGDKKRILGCVLYLWLSVELSKVVKDEESCVRGAAEVRGGNILTVNLKCWYLICMYPATELPSSVCLHQACPALLAELHYAIPMMTKTRL